MASRLLHLKAEFKPPEAQRLGLKFAKASRLSRRQA